MSIARQSLILAGAALAIFCVSGCGEKEAASNQDAPEPKGETVESIAKELRGKMLEFATAARSATDTESAEKAADTLEELGTEMKKIAERLAELEVPSEEVRKELGNDLREAEEEIEKRIGDAEDFWDKLDPAANTVLEEGIGAFGKKMQEAMVVFQEYFEMERGEK